MQKHPFTEWDLVHETQKHPFADLVHETQSANRLFPQDYNLDIAVNTRKSYDQEIPTF